LGPCEREKEKENRCLKAKAIIPPDLGGECAVLLGEMESRGIRERGGIFNWGGF